MCSLKERFKMIVAVHLVVLHNNEILLLKRYNTGYEDGKFSVPAGHVEDGENVIQAMVRESQEEIGIEITNSSLEIIHVMNRNCIDHERIDYFFKVSHWHGEIRNMEPNKCSELSWFNIENLPFNTIDYIKEAIENYINGCKFSVYGWNVKHQN